MIKKNEINNINVDDYIRQQKKKGQRRFFWHGRAREAFRNFSESIFSDPFCGYPEKYFIVDEKVCTVKKKRSWKNYPQGDMFMGVKHFSK